MNPVPSDDLPLVVHLLYRLDFGGLETVLVECVNRMRADRYRHAIVCITSHTRFADKISRAGVELFALDKAPGLGLGTHAKFWKLLRQLRPTILHTYNLSAIEYAVTAAAAGVPVRIHAEHGRDLSDPTGSNRKHNVLRKLVAPFIDCFVPVSRDLRQWLGTVIGIPDARNLLINNGVDTTLFAPGDSYADIAGTQLSGHPSGQAPDRPFVIGTVGRVQDIKNHKGLVITFERVCALLPEQANRLKLVIAGDGPLMPALKAQVAASPVSSRIELLGARADIAAVMQGFSVFCLPSFAEGTPITLLEAMACGLPVVASAVGGIPDVVDDGHTGVLVAPTDHDAMASALAAYVGDPARAARHGMAGRSVAETHYSIDAMLMHYTALYDALCARKVRTFTPRKANPSCVE